MTERLRSVGEQIDEILSKWQPTPEQIRTTETELKELGQDPKNAKIVLAVRKPR